MSVWLVVLVSAIYAVAGVCAALDAKPGLAMFCLGCVIANIGIVMLGR